MTAYDDHLLLVEYHLGFSWTNVDPVVHPRRLDSAVVGLKFSATKCMFWSSRALISLCVIQEEEVRTPVAEKSYASVVCFRMCSPCTYSYPICRACYYRYTMRNLHLLAL
jgi:hypothetical protein